MEEQIIDIISRIIKIERKELQTRVNEEGLWDSFNGLEIVLALEESFDIMLKTEEIGNMKTINQILCIVKELIE